MTTQFCSKNPNLSPLKNWISVGKHLEIRRRNMPYYGDLYAYAANNFLLNNTSKPQNSCIQKTPQLNAPQGNIYMGARYLDPKYSRWISVDPALAEYIPGAGKSNEADKLPGMGGVFNSVNLLLFHYAGNNPVRYVDPDGRVDWDEIGNELITEIKRTFNGDFGIDFFVLSTQAYENGDYLRGFAYSLNGTAELIFDFFSLNKIAEGIEFLAKRAESSISGLIDGFGTTVPAASQDYFFKLSQNIESKFGVSIEAQEATFRCLESMVKAKDGSVAVSKCLEKMIASGTVGRDFITEMNKFSGLLLENCSDEKVVNALKTLQRVTGTFGGK